MAELTVGITVFDQLLQDLFGLLEESLFLQSLRLAEHGLVVLGVVMQCLNSTTHMFSQQKGYRLGYGTHLICGLNSAFPVLVLQVALGHIRVDLLR